MAILSRRKLSKEALLEATITTVLAEVGPLLRIEHFTMEIVEYSNVSGQLVLRIDGSCPDCEVSPATFIPAIEAHLKMRVPEVREVRVLGQ